MSMEDCGCLFNIQATTHTNEYGAYMNTFNVATKNQIRLRLSETFTRKVKDSCWLHKRGHVKFVVPLICQPSCEYRSQGGGGDSVEKGVDCSCAWRLPWRESYEYKYPSSPPYSLVGLSVSCANKFPFILIWRTVKWKQLENTTT